MFGSYQLGHRVKDASAGIPTVVPTNKRSAVFNLVFYLWCCQCSVFFVQTVMHQTVLTF